MFILDNTQIAKIIKFKGCDLVEKSLGESKDALPTIRAPGGVAGIVIVPILQLSIGPRPACDDLLPFKFRGQN